MKPSYLYKSAAGLLLFFAGAHTMGMLNPKSPTPDAAAVRSTMDIVHFPFMGFNCSYGNFYFGFGMLLTVYLLFSVFLAWRLGGAAGKQPAVVSLLAWPLFAAVSVVAVLGWVYFFPAPAVVSTLAAICLGLAATKSKRK